ncbi:hypothetical protein ABZ312_39115 [Streptomyces sp. NPDC006207]
MGAVPVAPGWKAGGWKAGGWKAGGWKAGGWPAEFTFRDLAEPDDELCCGECGGPVECC